MNPPPDVTLCIVNYNGAGRLPRTLACVEAQALPFNEVILIDDASQDDSVVLAQRIAPQIRVIQQESNRGPGAARNVGFSAATNDLILFIDNDVYLNSNTAVLLIKHLRQYPDALLVTPRVVYDDNPGVIQYDSADCHFLGLMATRNADTPIEAVSADPTETDSVVTACFLIDRRHWHGGCPFDESFGFYMEDHDFGLRCRLLGHHLWVHPGAQVQHGSGTPGLSYRPGGRSSDERLLQLTANRWLIVGKCFTARTLLLLAPALLTFEIMQWLWLTGHGHFDVWCHAVRSLQRRWNHLQTERRAVQRTRRIADRELLRDLPLPLTSHVRKSGVSAMLLNMADNLLRAYFKLIYRGL